MKTALAVITGTVVLMGGLAAGQEPPPNAPKFVKSVREPGLGVRYLDFKWDEESVNALETGGAHPAAQRSWVLARLMMERPFKWNGRTIPVGSILLILNPSKGGAASTLELRKVDMREIFVDMNVIAEPPPNDSYGTVPANFTKVETVAPRLAVATQGKGNDVVLTVHYGNRQTTITLVR